MHVDVRGLRNSSAAISRFVRPTATSRITSSSRRDRPAPVGSAAARRPRRCSTDSPSLGRLGRGPVCQRPGAELAGEAIGPHWRSIARLTLAGSRQRHARAELDLRSFGGDPEPAWSSTARRIARWRLRLALGERDLAERVGQRRDRVGVSRRRGDRRGASRTRVPRRSARPGRRGRPPSAIPRWRSDGPRSVPSERARSGSARGGLVRALVILDPGQSGGAVDLHRDDADAGGGVQAGRAAGARRPLASEGVVPRARRRRPDRRPRRVDQVAAELVAAAPLAQLAQHIRHAGEARGSRRVAPAMRQSPTAVVSALSAPA